MTIEELELRIESDAQGAASSVDSLTKSLTALKGSTANSAGLGKVVTHMEKLNVAAGSINMNGFAEQMTKLVAGLKPLESLGKNNLTSFVTQLGKLPALTEGLEKLNFTSLADSIRKVADAMRPLATEMEKISMGFSAMPKRLQSFITQMDKSGKTSTTAAQGYKSAANGLSLLNQKVNLGALYAGLRRITTALSGFVENSNQYVEDMNLFTVSMGEYADAAYEYAQRAQELMGIDAGQFMRNQGFFQSIASGFGVASDSAALMSQNLAQLGYDLASFYNSNVETAMQKLQSGLAGELEPLRRWGFALDQVTLNEVAMSHGIQMNIRDMTQAQKSMVRYIAIMEQSTNAQHDMARTLSTPANAMRIMSQQVTLLGRSIGNLLIPMLSAILPWAIAAAKALRMLADTIASFFGVSLPTIDYGAFGDMSVGVDDAAIGAGDLEDNLGGAAKEAKKLKDYVMGFDELNIISPPEEPTGGSGGSAGGGGGFEGLDLPQYDFLDGLSAQADKLVQKLKELLPLLLAIGTALGLAAFAKWAQGASDLARLLGGLAVALAGLIGYVWGFNDAWENGVDWLNLTAMVAGAAAMIVGLAIAFSPLVGGIAGVAAGIGILVVSIRDIIQNGAQLENVVGIIAGLAVVIAGAITATDSWWIASESLKQTFAKMQSIMPAFFSKISKGRLTLDNIGVAANAAAFGLVAIAAAAAGAYFGLSGLFKEIQAGTAGFGDWAKAIGIVVAALGVAAIAVYAMGTALTVALGPIGWTIAAITAVVAGIGAVVAGIFAWINAEKEQQIAQMTTTMFLQEGGIALSEYIDVVSAATGVITENTQAIISGRESLESQQESIRTTSYELQAYIGAMESSSASADIFLPHIAELFESLARDATSHLQALGDELIRTFSQIAPEAYERAGVAADEALSGIATWTQEAVDKIQAMTTEYSGLQQALSEGTATEENIVRMRELEQELANAGIVMGSTADTYLSELGNLPSINFSELLADPENLQGAADALDEQLQGVYDTGAEAQQALIDSHAATIASLDEAVRNGMDPALYDELKAVAEEAFKLDSAKIAEAQATAITDITSQFQSQMDAATAGMSDKAAAEFTGTFEDALAGAAAAVDTITMGQPLGDGFIEGFANGLGNIEDIVSGATQLGTTLVGTVKTDLDINSPSKVAEDLGSNFDTGFANGIQDNTNLAVTPAAKLGADTTKALTDAINKNAASPVTAFKNMLNQMLSAVSQFSSNVASGMNQTLQGMASAAGSMQATGASVTFGAPMAVATVPQLASGGAVSAGQLFVAGENGTPEFVGRFGSKSGVMNPDQMEEAVARAVRDAMIEVLNANAGAFSPNVEINIDDDAIARSNMRGVKRYGYQTTKVPVG